MSLLACSSLPQPATAVGACSSTIYHLPSDGSRIPVTDSGGEYFAAHSRRLRASDIGLQQPATPPKAGPGWKVAEVGRSTQHDEYPFRPVSTTSLELSHHARAAVALLSFSQIAHTVRVTRDSASAIVQANSGRHLPIP